MIVLTLIVEAMDMELLVIATHWSGSAEDMIDKIVILCKRMTCQRFL